MKRRKDDLDRYTEELLKRHPEMKGEMDKVREEWDIAFQVVNLRKKAGLTQKQLAELVGTKQSNIARLESADNTSYTRETLYKIAKALKARLEIRIVPLESSKSAQV
ncbi:MAG: helix-turn-helix domain-containing protein [Candidatus Daviesbacteria bacterium]|nr:helix-turn-helix domain-containing protein [Candidatus Daviesbacteria bacterium]